MYNAPGTPSRPGQQMAAQPGYPPVYPPRPAHRRHRALRLLAAGCVISAWATLVLSLVSGIGMIATSQLGSSAGLSGVDGTGPSALPGSGSGMGGLGDLEGGGGSAGDPRGQALSNLISLLMPRLMWMAALFTIASGVMAWLLQLAMGLLIYCFLDMEENTRLTAQALTAIARRTGA